MYIKSRFGGIRSITYEDALDWAIFKYKALYSGVQSNDKILEMINKRLIGIKFTLKDITEKL